MIWKIEAYAGRRVIITTKIIIQRRLHLLMPKFPVKLPLHEDVIAVGRGVPFGRKTNNPCASVQNVIGN
jgi:hypothetical protein